MKIIITGSTGFVGRQILEKLMEVKDNQLVAIIRKEKISEFSKYFNKVKVIVSDDIFSENQVWWSKVLRGADIFIHCAWYVEPQNYLKSPKNIDCLIGTLTLAKSILQSSIKKFIGLGTCFEYDLSQGYVSRNTPIKPQTLYASTKASLNILLENLFSESEIKFIWCRLFYLFGEGEDPRRLYTHIVNNLKANKIVELTSGDQIRDFLDVKVAAQEIVNLIYVDYHGVVNICSGIPISVRDFAEDIAKKNGYDLSLLKFGARKENIFDPPVVVGIK